MIDPWDDGGRGQAGVVVTAKGLRVPVAAPTSPAGWPVTPGAPQRNAPPAAGTQARYRGVGPKGYQRADPYIREQVCERLLLDPYLDASAIVVTVSKGRVALAGSVPSERMRAAAIAAASSVAAGAVDARLQVTAALAGRPSPAPSARSGARVRSRRKRGGSR
jgi:BON domain